MRQVSENVLREGKILSLHLHDVNSVGVSGCGNLGVGGAATPRPYQEGAV